jgi:hypothetical protein
MLFGRVQERRNDVEKQGPRLTEAAQAERKAREKRLADALRQNLRRRKEQMRARASSSPSGAAETDQGDGTASGNEAAGRRALGKPDDCE